MDLIKDVLKANMRAVARLISIIENDGGEKERIVDELYEHTGKSLILGITGPTGSGKSTLVDKLIKRERKQGRKVAVIAVDPSSPFSGGALLGDRIRMQFHAADPGVFIRSMASRGYLGGVAQATGDVIRVMEAAGYETIIIETVGIGQSEIEIVEMSDLVLLVLAPGMGDEIQAMKAGIMEIGDIFVINKKDKDGAEKLKADVDYVLGLKYMDNREEKNPLVLVSAVNDDGIDELAETNADYLEKIEGSGLLARKRKSRIENMLRKIFQTKIHRVLDSRLEFSKNIDDWVESIYRRSAKPYALINAKMNEYLKEHEQL